MSGKEAENDDGRTKTVFVCREPCDCVISFLKVSAMLTEQKGKDKH